MGKKIYIILSMLIVIFVSISLLLFMAYNKVNDKNEKLKIYNTELEKQSIKYVSTNSDRIRTKFLLLKKLDVILNDDNPITYIMIKHEKMDYPTIVSIPTSLAELFEENKYCVAVFFFNDKMKIEKGNIQQLFYEGELETMGEIKNEQQYNDYYDDLFSN